MDWYIPLLIFAARVGDVSIGTVRTMLVIGGHRYLSALLGFAEVSIWVLAVGGTLAYLDSPIAVCSYAGGFAAGIIIGMWIEERIALGYRLVRIIATDPHVDLCGALRDSGFRVTRVDGRGKSGPVEIAFLVVRRRSLNQLRRVTHDIVPEAFIAVERVETPTGGEFTNTRFSRSFLERIVVRK